MFLIVSKFAIFLGHMVSKKGIQVDPTKVDKITQWPAPATGKTTIVPSFARSLMN